MSTLTEFGWINCILGDVVTFLDQNNFKASSRLLAAVAAQVDKDLSHSALPEVDAGSVVAPNLYSACTELH